MGKVTNKEKRSFMPKEDFRINFPQKKPLSYASHTYKDRDRVTNVVSELVKVTREIHWQRFLNDFIKESENDSGNHRALRHKETPE